MRFVSFRIQNFKGIEDTTIKLAPSGANVFTLIGLNESGKTSILEAINAFRPDNEYKRLMIQTVSEAQLYSSYIPKQYQANFSDKIRITATLTFESGELATLLRPVEEKFSVLVDPSSIPNPIEITREYWFEDSVHTETWNIFNLTPRVKGGGERKFKNSPHPSDIWKDITSAILASLPSILYFPTFLFNMPPRIVLNPDPVTEDKSNAIYRKIIDDIAASLSNKIDVQKHIVDRMIGKGGGTAKTATGVVVFGNPQQQQAAAALNEISKHISRTVFGEWKQVLGSHAVGRELMLQPGIEVSKDDKAKVFVQFMMREGGHTYDISERSLGFRWFFSYLLFTFYRAAGNSRGSTLFLLDEPASNLHSKAQTQLIESFPRIAVGSNMLMYSTHSHYMVNPAWLEQAFIVSNSAMMKAEEMEDGRYVDVGPINVSAKKYRQFVGENPDQMTYFQPVLDQLDVVPSRLDLVRPSMLVEGKGDYALIASVAGAALDAAGMSVVPTRGATGMDELIGLFLGWGVPFCVCLDDDKEGRDAKKRYLSDWGLPEAAVFTYGDIDAALKGKKLESFASEGDLQVILEHFGLSPEGKLSKDQIRLYFSECLAKGVVPSVSEETRVRVEAVVTRGVQALHAVHS